MYFEDGAPDSANAFSVPPLGIGFGDIPMQRVQSNSSDQAKKRKDGGNSNSRDEGKRRFVWPDSLHRDFIAAVFDIGLKATSVKEVGALLSVRESAGVTGEQMRAQILKLKVYRAGEGRGEGCLSYTARERMGSGGPGASGRSGSGGSGSGGLGGADLLGGLGMSSGLNICRTHEQREGPEGERRHSFSSDGLQSGSVDIDMGAGVGVGIAMMKAEPGREGREGRDSALNTASAFVGMGVGAGSLCEAPLDPTGSGSGNRPSPSPSSGIPALAEEVGLLDAAISSQNLFLSHLRSALQRQAQLHSALHTRAALLRDSLPAGSAPQLDELLLNNSSNPSHGQNHSHGNQGNHGDGPHGRQGGYASHRHWNGHGNGQGSLDGHGNVGNGHGAAGGGYQEDGTGVGTGVAAWGESYYRPPSSQHSSSHHSHRAYNQGTGSGSESGAGSGSGSVGYGEYRGEFGDVMGGSGIGGGGVLDRMSSFEAVGMSGYNHESPHSNGMRNTLHTHNIHSTHSTHGHTHGTHSKNSTHSTLAQLEWQRQRTYTNLETHHAHASPYHDGSREHGNSDMGQGLELGVGAGAGIGAGTGVGAFFGPGVGIGGIGVGGQSGTVSGNPGLGPENLGHRAELGMMWEMRAQMDLHRSLLAKQQNQLQQHGGSQNQLHGVGQMGGQSQMGRGQMDGGRQMHGGGCVGGYTQQQASSGDYLVTYDAGVGQGMGQGQGRRDMGWGMSGGMGGVRAGMGGEMGDGMAMRVDMGMGVGVGMGVGEGHPYPVSLANNREGHGQGKGQGRQDMRMHHPHSNSQPQSLQAPFLSCGRSSVGSGFKHGNIGMGIMDSTGGLGGHIQGRGNRLGVGSSGLERGDRRDSGDSGNSIGGDRREGHALSPPTVIEFGADDGGDGTGGGEGDGVNGKGWDFDGDFDAELFSFLSEPPA